VTTLDLEADAPTLAATLVDVYSVSGSESVLADAVEEALRVFAHLRVDRDGDAVIARTELGRPERAILAGHLDTVPEAGNFPSRREAGVLHGLGSVDMKGGLAVALRLAAGIPEPARDVTYVFYDCEEVEQSRSGLARVQRQHPEWLAADFAVLMEPTDCRIEAGCQGTMRIEVMATGLRAHTARSWMGANAIHAAGEIVDRLVRFEPRRPVIDGLEYREGLNAVRISGGVAGNVIPDQCTVTVNYRFAPDRTSEQAELWLRDFFDGFDVTVVDSAAGALPGLDRPAAAAFVEAVGGGTPARPKFGWTDVARFAAAGMPAVNYGPGNPSLAHTADEQVAEADIVRCEDRLRAWLRSGEVS
jgi:succinyl-diaminopimelate desuccinylase